MIGAIAQEGKRDCSLKSKKMQAVRMRRIFPPTFDISQSSTNNTLNSTRVVNGD